VDWATAGEFEGFLCDNCVEPVVVVNLTGARFDAAGTGALLVATERAGERGQQIVVVATDPLQLAVLRETGLNIVVPIVDSEVAALAWCERNSLPIEGGGGSAGAGGSTSPDGRELVQG